MIASCRIAAPALLLLSLLALGACGRGSAELSTAYAGRLDALRQQGLGRTDAAPADAPWGAEELARNFARVVHAKDHPRREEQPLRKWRVPALYRFYHGDAGPDEAERAHMADLARRISAATGLEVREARELEDANLFILHLDYEEREALLRTADVDEDDADMTEIHELIGETHGNENNLCMFSTGWDTGDDERWTSIAVTVIRSELPTDWRMSCLDEEVTQMFGPQYDHPEVRPSMFNDDEEFLYLTDHDEAMLRLIYDPRLRSGMTLAQTTPIVREILAEGRIVPAPGS
ncbi:DUF2927 domain-containing protein [Albimonas sp. CAU 1670]|uniref:DUF2927 domain-containing protein n=1 Tax=Albimonas sp. CAU 1670 TaxID=3032599 RepID=UPI0023DC3B2A|nr:DUF2927 domain-containing protein [Albimonas sp. CAU 1670]MDF2232239.1 DUF2927 domain-containing protein [Albimonas sp. CAU 1670]